MPECWCYPRQCHGDADGDYSGSYKSGYYYVGTEDMNLLTAYWRVKEPPHGPGIDSIPNGICADFAHDIEGSQKAGFWRVGSTDLAIILEFWQDKEPPQDSGVGPNCRDY